MAKLTAKSRAKIPTGEFALPGRRFPVQDKTHAVSAKARATQGVNNGTLTPAEKSKVDTAANRVLKSGRKK